MRTAGCRHLLAAAATLSLTASLAGCGSGSSAAPRATDTGGSSRPARCRTADLRVTQLSSQGAAGHGVNVFRVRNVSQSACQIEGYFAVQLLGRHGRALPTAPRRVTRDFAPNPQPQRRVVLRPGESGSFRIATSHVRSPCVAASAISVSAPGDSNRQTVSLGREGLYACPRGALDLAPLQPRDGAAT